MSLLVTATDSVTAAAAAAAAAAVTVAAIDSFLPAVICILISSVTICNRNNSISLSMTSRPATGAAIFFKSVKPAAPNSKYTVYSTQYNTVC